AGTVAPQDANARRTLRVAALRGLPAVRPGRVQFQVVSAEDSNIHRGLEGVVVDTTRISKVMPEINALVYYGYPVQELAEQCSFEEVAWLIWHGELPNAKQLAGFQAAERSQRELSADLLAVLQRCPNRAHPMD